MRQPENLTVVIPTLKESKAEIPTLESVPDDVPVLLQDESPIATARNRGVERAETEYIIQLDDDIKFDRDVWDGLVHPLDETTVVGMADWDFGLIVTRMIGFHRDAWADVGGFDERLGSHMEDTDFAIKLEKAGYDLSPIDQAAIHHFEHDSRITTKDRVWRLVYLALKHPTYAHTLATGVL